MRVARILSTGRYVPARIVTNADLEARLGEPVDDWLVQNVGIRERRVMADSEVTSDLAAHAAREALARAGVEPADLDLVVVATDTPDQPSPATASVLQYKLGARSAGTSPTRDRTARRGPSPGRSCPRPPAPSACPARSRSPTWS